jgi:hypothetical protein
MESKQRTILIGVLAALAIGILGFSVFRSTGSTAETHRELKDVPPKGAGRFDRE